MASLINQSKPMLDAEPDPMAARSPDFGSLARAGVQAIKNAGTRMHAEGTRLNAESVEKGFTDPKTGRMTRAGVDNMTKEFMESGMMFDSGGIVGAAGRAAGRVGAGLINRTMQPLEDIVAKKTKVSYKPPSKPDRPFEADYPGGAKTDDAGRLVETMDGQPIAARYVVGRRDIREPDVALTPEEYVAAFKRLLGAVPTPVAAREIGGDAGRLVPGAHPVTGNPDFRLLFDKSLKPGAKDDTIAHELSHGIDYLAKTIPQNGIKRELAEVWNTMNTGVERVTNLSTPQSLQRYSDKAAPGELMAEAIRAYIQNPNYLKTVAPAVAARIRAYVNANPNIREIIQFNSLVATAGAAGAATGGKPGSDGE